MQFNPLISQIVTAYSSGEDEADEASDSIFSIADLFDGTFSEDNYTKYPKVISKIAKDILIGWENIYEGHIDESTPLLLPKEFELLMSGDEKYSCTRSKDQINWERSYRPDIFQLDDPCESPTIFNVELKPKRPPERDLAKESPKRCCENKFFEKKDEIEGLAKGVLRGSKNYLDFVDFLSNTSMISRNPKGELNARDKIKIKNIMTSALEGEVNVNLRFLTEAGYKSVPIVFFEQFLNQDFNSLTVNLKVISLFNTSFRNKTAKEKGLDKKFLKIRNLTVNCDNLPYGRSIDLFVNRLDGEMIKKIVFTKVENISYDNSFVKKIKKIRKAIKIKLEDLSIDVITPSKVSLDPPSTKEEESVLNIPSESVVKTEFFSEWNIPTCTPLVRF